MNLQQLEYILAVDRYRSFSKAANHCNVTQATLSAMVKKLEEELDMVLFDRKRSPVITTDCGKAIIEEARKVIHHSEQLVELSKTVRHQIDGHVRLGIIPTIASNLLPIILKPILHKYPDLTLEIEELTTDQLIDSLKDGSIDLGILATPVETDQIEENILYYESMMVYGVAKETNQYTLSDQIKNSKIWLLEEGHCFRDQTIEICNLSKKDDLPDNLIFEANSFDTLLNITDEFGGITLIPELLFNTLPKKRKDKTRPFQNPVPVREVSLVYYRPYSKLRIIDRLTQEIKSIMKGKLVTDQMHAKDLSIIGI